MRIWNGHNNILTKTGIYSIQTETADSREDGTKDDKQEKSVHASITLERKTWKRDVTSCTFITSLKFRGYTIKQQQSC